MKKSYQITGALVAFLFIVLLSSFVLIDLNESQTPLLPEVLSWVSDHKVLAALAVSETTGLFSKKVRGIVHGAFVALKAFISIFSINRRKA